MCCIAEAAELMWFPCVEDSKVLLLACPGNENQSLQWCKNFEKVPQHVLMKLLGLHTA